MAFREGDLYVTEASRIIRYDDIEARLNNTPEPVVVKDGLPSTGHSWKFIRFGPNGMLNVPTVGFDWSPEGELWFTDNGRDWMGEDIPDDELNRAPREGLHFGDTA